MATRRWRRTWDWWTADSAGTGSNDLPVRAAEWVAERRDQPPSLATGVVVLCTAGVVGAIDALVASHAGTAVLWAPVIVLTIVAGTRVATAACTATAVAVGILSDQAADQSAGITVVDALFRFAGLFVIAVLASWAVLATVELARRGTTDHGTGLLNRAGFFAALERERERARREGQALSLVYFDVDGLKEANDAHGHAHGDEVLRRFATHLDRSRRLVDVAARLGGDEFALLLPGADTVGVQQVLRRLFDALDRDRVCLSASAGAVTWLDPPAGGVMLRQADDAMYRVKQAGGRSWTVLDLTGEISPPTARTA
ncbi:MAG TPA: GGDEF domain-containing protein [Acidimicrobiales bacterium]|nr:GGDEF domain-containing protein [Acidimicrobiales bacterium]